MKQLVSGLVPELTSYIASRSNLTTATNPDSRLLFPGRRAGQPLHPNSLRLRLHTLGIPNLSGRTSAIRELLLQAPAPVVAAMLGYDPTRAEKLATDAGATWKRYAAGDHTRTAPRARLIDYWARSSIRRGQVHAVGSPRYRPQAVSRARAHSGAPRRHEMPVVGEALSMILGL